MGGIDYRRKKAAYCGRPTSVAWLLKEAWSTGNDDAIAALGDYANESNDNYIDQTFHHLSYIYTGAPSSSHNLPGIPDSDDEIINKFKGKSQQFQIGIIKKAMRLLLEEYDNRGKALFSQKQDWIGVYVLIKSRLNKRIIQKGFHAYAKEITPDDFPDKLRIGNSTISNISHMGLPDVPYFQWKDRQMEHNNHAARMHKICTRLWAIIVQCVYENS